MSCEMVRHNISLYIDSELPSELAAGIARHLEVCPSCRARIDAEQRIEGAIRAALGRPQPGDAEAWSRAVAALPRRRVVPWIAAAAAVVLAALGLWVLLHPRELDLARELAEHHEKVLAGNAPLSLETSDPTELNAYFRDKLACSAELRRDLPAGVRLAGGRMCYVEGVPSAFYVLHRGSVAITVCISPGEVLDHFPAARERLEREDPVHCQVGDLAFLTCRMGGRIVCAVGAVPPEDLVRVADSFR